MATIPIWLLGKHVTTVTARFQLAASTGLLGHGTGSAQTLTGLVDEISYQGTNATENIFALTSERDNEVVIESDDTFTLTEIMRYGAGNCLLAAMWDNADSAEHCLITLTRGGNTFTFYGVMAEYSETVRKGKNVARLTVKQVDIEAGTANPAYA